MFQKFLQVWQPLPLADLQCEPQIEVSTEREIFPWTCSSPPWGPPSSAQPPFLATAGILSSRAWSILWIGLVNACWWATAGMLQMQMAKKTRLQCLWGGKRGVLEVLLALCPLTTLFCFFFWDRITPSSWARTITPWVAQADLGLIMQSRMPLNARFCCVSLPSSRSIDMLSLAHFICSFLFFSFLHS